MALVTVAALSNTTARRVVPHLSVRQVVPRREAKSVRAAVDHIQAGLTAQALHGVGAAQNLRYDVHLAHGSAPDTYAYATHLPLRVQVCGDQQAGASHVHDGIRVGFAQLLQRVLEVLAR